MRIALLPALATLAVLFVGLNPAVAADKARELIVGKWKPVAEDGKAPELEFTKDGKVTVSEKEFKANGTYKFVGDDKLEVSIDFMGEKLEVKLTIKKIEKDEMILIESEKKKEDVFKRVK